MKLSPEEIDDLIAKQLAGEAQEDEITRLNSWKQESVENLAFYNESVDLFRRIDSLTTPINVNVDTAWQQVDERISSKPEAKVISLFYRKNLVRAAASILLLAILSI